MSVNNVQRRNIGFRNFVRYYRNKYKKSERPDISVFRDLVNSYHKFIRNKIIEGHQVVLPQYCGALWIVGKKDNPRKAKNVETNLLLGIVPNWAETLKLWKRDPEAKAKKKIIYCDNLHTDGVRYKISWLRKNARNGNIMFYFFRPCKEFRRSVHKRIMEGAEYYVKNYGY